MLNDSTCYVGCTPPHSTLTTIPSKLPANIHIAHPLALTGASIELMVLIGLALLVVGFGLVRRRFA